MTKKIILTILIVISTFGVFNFIKKHHLEITTLFEILYLRMTQHTPPLNINDGNIIPSESGYVDQPYIVKLKDGSWLCVMTTGKNREGSKGQHIVSTISKDRGNTWSQLTDIEPASGPEASWAMPFLTPQGRVYVFYTYNADDIRDVAADTEYSRKRVDLLGKYAFKFSDDGGTSWTKKRWYIPIRTTNIDKENPYKGKIKFFWGVGKPIIHNDSMYLGFSKIGKLGTSEVIPISESWIIKSNNILFESNPENIEWELLPEGSDGLKAVKGNVAEEISIVSLSDGSLYSTYRTIEGHPAHAYSRDNGRSWTKSEFMRHKPNGKLINNPRAANFVRKITDGKYKGRYIYWFHNNNRKDYKKRNPVYLLGGQEVDSPEGKLIYWNKPIAILYSLNLREGISYPDFIWDNGLYVTETQKSIARTHLIPDSLIELLWN